MIGYVKQAAVSASFKASSLHDRLGILRFYLKSLNRAAARYYHGNTGDAGRERASKSLDWTLSYIVGPADTPDDVRAIFRNSPETSGKLQKYLDEVWTPELQSQEETGNGKQQSEALKFGGNPPNSPGSPGV